MTPPIALPWLSPNDINLKILPNVFIFYYKVYSPNYNIRKGTIYLENYKIEVRESNNKKVIKESILLGINFGVTEFYANFALFLHKKGEFVYK